MLIYAFLYLIVEFLSSFMGWLGLVDKLPTILGFDLDGALVTGVGALHTFMDAFWPIAVLMEAFSILMVYYALKFVLRTILGSRAPH